MAFMPFLRLRSFCKEGEGQLRNEWIRPRTTNQLIRGETKSLGVVLLIQLGSIASIVLLDEKDQNLGSSRVLKGKRRTGEGEADREASSCGRDLGDSGGDTGGLVGGLVSVAGKLTVDASSTLGVPLRLNQLPHPRPGRFASLSSTRR